MRNWRGAIFKQRKARLERESVRIAQSLLGSSVNIEQRPELDVIVFDDVQLKLSGLRDRYRQLEPGEATSWLRSALTEVLVRHELPDTLEDPSALMPGLRPRSFLESHRLIGLQRGQVPSRLALRPVSTSLSVGLFWDETHSTLPLPESQLDVWGRTYEEALAVAQDNLASEPVAGWAAMDDRAFRLIGGDDYVSARLLDRSVFDRLEIDGAVVACVPTRGELIASALDDPEGMKLAFQMAIDAVGHGPGLSLRPIVSSVDGWTELELEADHPAYTKWRTLIRLDVAHEADSTRFLLQQLVGTDVFVGSVIVREEHSTGRVDTVSVWSEGVPTLLATADLVAFPRSDHDAGFVTAPWARVRSVLGDRMTPTDHYPERWIVDSFPSDSELAALVNR